MTYYRKRYADEQTTLGFECESLELAAERLGVAYSTAKENITRVRVKYVEVGRPAPTKVDLLRRAMEDGILHETPETPGDV